MAQFQARKDKSMEQLASSNASQESLIAAYDQICKSFHAIDDFRAKLLGLLPLASGTGLLFLLSDKVTGEAIKSYALPLGCFGFIITLGLFIYEIRFIKRCSCLIANGRCLEQLLMVKGQFSNFPSDIFGYISANLPACIIYPAVLASGAFFASTIYQRKISLLVSLVVLVFAVGISIWISQAMIKSTRKYYQLED